MNPQHVMWVSSCVALVTNHKCLASTRSDSRHPILNADELEGMQTYRAQKRCTVHRCSPERRSETSSEVATAGLQRAVFWIEKDANSFSGISIKDLKQIRHSYKCKKCGEIFTNMEACNRHEKTCDELVKHTFPGGKYDKSLNLNLYLIK